MLMGHDVICLDSYFTGNKANVAHWIGHPNFELIRHDVVDSIMLEVDQIYHLACPASPVHYQSNPVKTLKTGFLGTFNMLGLAKRVKARILIASTSEIYGDPLEHPQKESYWGNVNCQGPRACYDESKRVGETLAYGYMAQDGVQVRIARIFNTYGPRMNWNDGRVVSNFILQALNDKDLTIYGDGKSTRSFQYVMDLVDGLIALMNAEESDLKNVDKSFIAQEDENMHKEHFPGGILSSPFNIGNPEEYTINDFAYKTIELVKEITGKCNSEVIHLDALIDDPHRRKPDTTKAEKILNWKPKWKSTDGMRETIKYFCHQLKWLSQEIQKE